MSQKSAPLIEDPLTQQKEIDDRVFFGLIEKVGSFGTYQKVTTLLWCVIGYICGGLMLITPFLFYQDPYVCPDDISQCQSYVCGKDADQRTPFIPQKRFNSLANKFGDFRCHDEKIELDLIIFMMYVGAVVGFLISAVIGDHMGRKTLITLCLALNLIGMSLTILAPTLVVAGVGLFISTVGIQNGFNVCFYFLAETVAESHREKFSVAIQLFYGSGVLLNVPWFYLVGDWRLILIFFYLVPSLLVTISVLIFVRDTPICLVLRNSPERAYNAFKAIATINRIEHPEISKDQLQKIKNIYAHQHEEHAEEQSQPNNKVQAKSSSKRRTFTIFDLFRFPSLRWMTVFLIIAQCTIIFEFYAPALMLDKFKMDIFINGLVVGVSQIISYPFCYFLIMRSKRLNIAYICMATTAVCAGVLIFIWNQDQDESGDIGSNIGVLALIFIFRFAISTEYTFFYVYFNEVYPTQIRVIGTGLVSTMGAALVTVASIIIDSCIHAGIPVMAIFAGLSILTIVVFTRLPQTYNKPLPDIIEELKDSIGQRSSTATDLITDRTSEVKGKPSEPQPTSFTSS